MKSTHFPKGILFSGISFLLLFACFQMALSQTVFISPGATWKYLDDGSNQGTAWSATAFNDGSWSSGPAQLGYGDGDEATSLGWGINPFSRYITSYYRHAFNVSNPGLVGPLLLKILRDDGAVVYLNGQEIVRTNMPAGTITNSTVSSTDVTGSDENVWHTFFIPVSNFLTGTNVIAVEVHQWNGISTDLSFDLSLEEAGDPVVVRGPYLQTLTPNSVIVKWRTDIPTSSVLNYGNSFGNMNSVLVDSNLVTEHEMQVASLSPWTQYYYQLADLEQVFLNQDSSSKFKTAPTVGTVQPIRFWALGDCGTGNGNARAVRDAYYNYVGNNHTDMVLMLGDNAYETGTDANYQTAVFENMYEEMLRKTVLWSCPGNHDIMSASSGSQTGPYYDIFSFPTAAEAGGIASGTEAYYSWDYGNIHFISLDSEDSDLATSSAMMTWLQNDLGATVADWIIAIWHHPPYTKGSHDSDIFLDSGGRMEDMRQDFLPVLEAAGVDLVLNGHSHSYERSYLLHGHYGYSWDLTPTEVVNNGDGRANGDGEYIKTDIGPTAGKGAVYLTAGSSGKTSGGLLNHPAHYIALNTLGSLLVEVNNRQLDLKFINDQGVVDDYFTLIKDTVPVAIVGGLVQELEIAPNPAYGSTRIMLPNGQDHVFGLKVIDLQGKVLLEKQVSGRSYRLDLTEEASGIYIVRLEGLRSGKTYTGKVYMR